MSQMLRKAMAPEEFLAWEAKQERKWEFDGFEPVAMTGVTIAHSVIQGNINAALNKRLEGKPCQPYGPEVKVEIGSKYRYPDAFVSCTTLARNATVVADPVVVFEVLSESTARTDKTTKLTEYCSLSSVQRYVTLERDQAFATVISRTPAGWHSKVLDAAGVLTMPEIGVEVPTAELYAKLALVPANL